MRTAAIVSLLLLAGPAGAQNLQFLGEAPVAFADERDAALFDAALDQVMADGRPGDTRTWDNPQSTAKGTITLLERSDRDGLPCGRVRIRNEIKGRVGSGEYSLCMPRPGEWLMVPPQ